MSIEEDLARSSPGKELGGDTLLTIGVFDGVHLGHKHLLSSLKEKAKERNLLSGVVTFNPHPQKVLAPRSGLLFLTDIEQKVELLSAENVDAVFILPFDAELAQISADRFVGLMQQYLRMKGLVVGHNFALGRNREGSIDALRVLGEDMGFTVDVVPPLELNGEAVSSTLVRKALASGNMKRVQNLIGRPFSLHGQVVPGANRGAKLLGFPTANLGIDPEQAIPAEGVYATRACIDDIAYNSMTYVGASLTFGESWSMIEVCILDYSGDLYGKDLKVDFIERLRGGEKFDTVEKLRQQIAADIEKGRKLLESGAGSSC
ncbi:MAG: bifunctional riboflavin kinase/FAD synthetase [Dehalococcoidales bacterium]|nr:bifunctional riboflavin kinase/FAD synthetase [Dehalococcoidales bacterium]